MQEQFFSDKNSTEYTNEQLVEKASSGDERSVSELLYRMNDIVCKSVSLYIDNSLEKDDMVQECRIACLSAIKSYNPEKGSSFRTYAAVCINNRLLNFIKSKNSKLMVAQSQFLNIDDEGEDSFHDTSDISPEDIFIDNEQSERLNNIIKKVLSPLEYDVFRCVLEGLNYEETSEKLGISTKAVDNALQRLRKKLRNNSE